MSTVYENLQEKWVKENNITKGTKVRVSRSAWADERGWRNNWALPMNHSLGKEMTVAGFHGSLGVELEDGYDYPYYVLEVV